MKYMKYIFILAAVMFTDLLSAAALLLPGSAQHTASSSLVLLHTSPSGLIINPSCGCTGLEFTVSELYELSDLRCYNICGMKKWQHWQSGLYLSDLAHPHCNELTAAFNAAYHWKSISLGVNLRCLRVSITGKGSRKSALLDLGFSWRKGRFSSACSWQNCLEAKLAATKLPASCYWEGKINISQNLVFGFGFEKETGYDFQPKIATGFQVCDEFILSTSAAFNPQSIAAGFTVKLSDYQISYACQYHPQLDFSHYITIAFLKVLPPSHLR